MGLMTRGEPQNQGGWGMSELCVAQGGDHGRRQWGQVCWVTLENPELR